jgi:hypothetical protein
MSTDATSAQPMPAPASENDFKHDIYFASTNRTLYKFPVDPDGGYTRQPEAPAYSEPNIRHIHNLANPAMIEDSSRPRGPVFATLPVTKEPAATSFGICYVINPNNLRYRNAYTAEEWHGSHAPEASGPKIPEDFELLVAGPRGRIYHMKVTEHGESIECNRLEQHELKVETDIWEQLRNGTVVGRVLFRNEIVPLVNVTSVQPGGAS